MFQRFVARTFSTSATPEAYPAGMKALHWGMATGILGCVISVKAAQYHGKEEFKKDPEHQKNIGYWMKMHKSFGLTMAALILPRIFLRRASRLPAALPGPGWQTAAASANHYLLYFLITFLPTTGVLMGIFGGRGIPFFNFGTIPGVKKPVKAIAGNSYKTHKWAGKALQYVVPFHMGAVGYHRVVEGKNILTRIL